jgi:hypothetical protein
VAARKVEWSLNRDPDLIIEIWSTEALIEAVLAALLADPEAMKRAIAALSAARKDRGA